MSPDKPKAFPETRWSVVLNAQDDDPEALAQLCQTYWFPLYGYARRMGHSVDDAEDLTQAFFERLLSREGMKRVRLREGKLRSFLLTGLKNYATEQWRRSVSEKRGGGRVMIAIDALDAEQRLALEPTENVTPEVEFERRWAKEIMRRALARVEKAYCSADKGAVFSALRDQLDTESLSRSYQEVGVMLGISANAARFAAFKLRKRYREMLREEIQETVASAKDAEEEFAHLLNVFQSPAT